MRLRMITKWSIKRRNRPFGFFCTKNQLHWLPLCLNVETFPKHLSHFGMGKFFTPQSALCAIDEKETPGAGFVLGCIHFIWVLTQILCVMQLPDVSGPQ